MRTAILTLLALGLAATAGAAEATPTPAPVQTLESITIEGDVAVPQVLFITSREHPRHREDLGRRLRPTALAVAQRAAAPRRLVVYSDCVTATIKEQ